MVNISARELAGPEFEDRVRAILADTAMDPRMLSFEITETVLMDAASSALAVLRRLRALGAQVAIDDFGTGYSSLAYLKQFEVDALKVDRSFVRGLGRDPQDSAIVAAVVKLAHAIGLTAVAEGVETEMQLRHLREMGCDLAQGYYFARPMPADELIEMIQGRALTVA
jgi:EAL domain-containing protein (putative c-di-GMP-specific phosphodiesterase class I)